MIDDASAILRFFSVDNENWVAWVSGTAAYGTGCIGMAKLETVHFAPESARAIPRFEALIQAGRFFELFDEELIAVFRDARAVVIQDQPTERQVNRREGGLS